MDKIKLPDLVGITGANGAGKDVLAQLLVELASYGHVSLSNVLRTELTKRGQEHSRANLSALSHEIRSLSGDGAMVEHLFAESELADKLCITSVRTPGEAAAIKARGGVIIWVDADIELRYQRIHSGKRGRVSDQVSYQEFLDQEQNEMTPSEAGGGLNMAAVRDMADYTIYNNFPSLEEFKDDLLDSFVITDNQ